MRAPAALGRGGAAARPPAAPRRRAAAAARRRAAALRVAAEAPPRAPSSQPRNGATSWGAADPGSDSDGAPYSAALEALTEREAKKLRDYAEVSYLTGRTRTVSRFFPGALGVDDFMYRLEMALYAYGFAGDNSIAMVNLCRDEITVTLKNKLDQVFGSSFNVNGLGGVLTCGVTGVAAGLSHAPVSKGSGKERYVFFSFPHISVDAAGRLGAISRPGRPGPSCACGALAKALAELQAQGLGPNAKVPGVHEPLDPEFTILKQRLARRLRYEGADDAAVRAMSLVDVTRVAERTITDDLEYLISKCVDPGKADYAVVTGVQVHSWGEQFDDESPNLEYVAPQRVYVVVNGERTHVNLGAIPTLTPRQVRLLSARAAGGGGGYAPPLGDDDVCNSGGATTVREIDPPYLYKPREARRRARERQASYAALAAAHGLRPDTTCAWPSWQTYARAPPPEGSDDDDGGGGGRGNSAALLDGEITESAEYLAALAELQSKYEAQRRRLAAAAAARAAGAPEPHTSFDSAFACDGGVCRPERLPPPAGGSIARELGSQDEGDVLAGG